MRGKASNKMSRRFCWLIMTVCVSVALSPATTGRAQTTLSLVGTNVVLSFPTASNQVYYIQCRDSLATGSWSTIASNIVGTGLTWTNLDLGAATLLSRFYRVGSTTSGTGTVQVAAKLADGTVAAYAPVDIAYGAGTFHYAGATDGAGQLTITKVPVGSFTVQVADPDNLAVIAEVTSTLPSNGAVVSVTVNLPGLGQVDYQVNFLNGNSVPNAQVIMDYGTGPQTGYADGNGSGTFIDIPVGSFTLTAFNPHNASSYAEVMGNVASNGATATVTITLPTN
jgi:hypothetical protein